MTRPGAALAGRAALLAAWAAGLAAGGGCRCEEPPPPESVDVAFAGCAAVREGPVCLRAPDAPAPLTLWVPGDLDGPPAVTAGGAPLAAETRPLPGGTRVRVAVPAAAPRLALAAARGGRPLAWELALAPSPPCPPVEAALAARRAGESAAGLRALEAARAPDPACAAAALGLRARLLLDLGRPAEAAARLAESGEARRAAGDVSGWADDGFARAFVLTFRARDLAGARAALDALQAAPARYHEARARLPYFRGRLALEAGDLRAALADLEEADRWSERLGLTRLRLDALGARVDAWQALGRAAEARGLLEAVAAEAAGDLSPCERADLLANVGWQRLVAAEGAAAAGTPGPGAAAGGGADPLAEALALYEGACPRPSREQNVLVNLALRALQAGDVPGAAAALTRARARHDEPDSYVASWLEDLEGRVAVAEGRGADALARYEALAAASPPLSEARWRARLGRARALEALGRADDAVAAYRDAEDLLDEQLRLVPLGAGRGTFLGDRERGARRLVGLLLDAGRLDEAVAAARRSRARPLRALRRADALGGLDPAARARWEAGVGAFRTAREGLEDLRRRARDAPADEREVLLAEAAAAEARARAALDAAWDALGPAPPPAAARPPAGTVWLLTHPVEGGLAAFAVTADGATGRRLPALDPAAPPEALAAALLTPFDAALAGAARVEVLAHGDALAVDVHALPWRGAPLVAAVPVAWKLDVPTPARAAPAAGALVVVDPSGTLRGARADGEAAAERLRAAGVAPVEALAGDAATRAAVLAALPGVAAFHYAGHARFAGLDGWSSTLDLAAAGRLSVGDILALPAVPPRVVLSGCETARTDPRARAPTLGLGQAFVAAGSRAVVAASRPVDDAVAARLSPRLYAGGLDDPVAALAAAQRALAREIPAVDWPAWRALVP